MTITVNVERLAWACKMAHSFKEAYSIYLRSKKVMKMAYSTFCRKVHKFLIDVSHFVRKVRKWTEYDYVIHNHSIGKRPNSRTVKKVIAYLGEVCCTCGCTLGLELHHIDWNHNNTKISNLAVLCGTCHNNVHILGKKKSA